jgi:hypothetical protein
MGVSSSRLRCATKYAPWQYRASWTPANKLYVVETTGDDGVQMQHIKTALGAAGIPVGAGTFPEATGEPAAASDTGNNVSSVTFIPFQWSDTRTQALTNRMKELNIMRSDSVMKDEIMTSVAETGRMLAGQSQVELYERIKEFAVARAMAKSYFTDMQLSEHALWSIDNANKSSREHYSYAHLLQGFRGARFAWTQDTQVLSQEEVAKMWATIKMAVKAARQFRGRQ